MKISRAWWIAVGFALCIVAVPATTRASISLITWDEATSGLELSGYAWTLGGYQHLGYETPPGLADQRGLNTDVVRFEWSADLGEVVTLRVHNEFLWRLDSSGAGSGIAPQLGLESTRQPDRLLDLESEILDEQGIRFTHDVDRLAMDVYTRAVDLTIGRQGITWGRTLLFPVADLWSRFSPFELNTQDKPGIDAVRALFYPSPTSEIDVVVADRGSLEDLSGGVRGAFSLGRTDVFVAGGKFWNELALTSGVTHVIDRVKLRAEAALPWNLDDEALKRPRATAGLEYYTGDVTLGAEYHFNGAGASSASGYLETASSEVFQRGETYFLGRHYAGLIASYQGFEQLALELVGLGNLVDPSLLVAPSITYEIAQNTEAGIGAYVTAGDSPDLTAVPSSLQSEFGTYGNFYFFRLAAYF
jgi:hypothetical protein